MWTIPAAGQWNTNMWAKKITFAICVADLVTSSTSKSTSKISAHIWQACSASSQPHRPGTVQHLVADTWTSDWENVPFDDPDLTGRSIEALVEKRGHKILKKIGQSQTCPEKKKKTKPQKTGRSVRWKNQTPHPKLMWNRNFFFFKSATPAVEVSVGVPQQLFPVNVQTVYVVPGIADVALDPLHCVLLGQLASGRRAWFHCPRPFLLIIFVLIVVGWGGAGRRGGGGGGRGRWRGWRWE